MKISLAISFFISAATLGAIPVSTTGCNPAQSPIYTQIEELVLKDIESGVVLSAIEAAVVALNPALAAPADAAAKAIQAAIDFLESVGAIPQASAGYAAELKSAIAIKLQSTTQGK
jgi:hypothetical protein